MTANRSQYSNAASNLRKKENWIICYDFIFVLDNISQHMFDISHKSYYIKVDQSLNGLKLAMKAQDKFTQSTSHFYDTQIISRTRKLFLCRKSQIIVCCSDISVY